MHVKFHFYSKEKKSLEKMFVLLNILFTDNYLIQLKDEHEELKNAFNQFKVEAEEMNEKIQDNFNKRIEKFKDEVLNIF